MSIQGFLSDRSLINNSSAVVNLDTLNLPCGFLDRDTIEFFVKPAEISDLRLSRLAIFYRPESVGNVDDVMIFEDSLTTVYQKGIAHLITAPTETVTLAQYSQLDAFDFLNDVLPNDPIAISSSRQMTLTFDYDKLTGDDLAAINSLNNLEQQRIFNIIEYALYGTISVDNSSDINSELVNNPDKYLGYVANSIKLSTERSTVMIYGGVDVHRFSPQSLSFKFIIGNYTIQFQLWFNKSVFRSEYPESTIVNIIPPLDLNTLINPSALVDPINSAILSKKWSDALMKPELTDRDQSGMYLFETRYLHNGSTYQVVFSLIYRGRCPDSMEARNYIASYLLNCGIGTRALWETILPDVFYHSAFLLVPFYDNITKLTNADVYPSIIKSSDLADKINQITALIPRAIDPYRELMTAAYDKYFIGVAPADTNEYSSLLSIHPTYRDFTTSDSGWAEMTANTREWTTKLNQALAVAAGESNILSFSTVEQGGLRWVNFVYNYVSYLILVQADYLEFFGTE